MSCKFPVRMYRGSSGTVSHFERKVNNPLRRNPEFIKDAFWRPCQYCMDCRLRRAQSNAIRMTHEASFHEQSSFLTLTYDDAHLPPGGTLRYHDVKLFLGKLRSRLESTKYKRSLSYYRVGEYGSNFSRPHYHMVLFGFDFSDPLVYKGLVNHKSKSASKDDRIYYKSTLADHLWTNGFVDIGTVDYSTCMYTAKYVTKKLYGGDALKYGSLEPERSSSSKANPIGKRWIEKYFEDVYPHDYVFMDGKKLQPPRYYDEWLKANKPSLYSDVKRRREDSNLCDPPDWYTLHAQHVTMLQRQKEFLRDGCAPNTSLDEYLIEQSREITTSIHKGFLHASS